MFNVSTQLDTKATSCCHAFISNIFGPHKETGLGQVKYMLGVINHFSKYIWLVAPPYKKAFVSTLSSIFTDIRNLHSRLDHARTPTRKFDCGRNYVYVACRNMVSSLEYRSRFTAPYTHNQLAKMERQRATLADSTTAMLQHANYPTKYWGLAMRTAVYFRNRLRSPASSASSLHHSPWCSH
jgi:hypothetical protein